MTAAIAILLIPTEAHREAMIGAALALAEIERLDRAAGAK